MARERQFRPTAPRPGCCLHRYAVYPTPLQTSCHARRGRTEVFIDLQTPEGPAPGHVALNFHELSLSQVTARQVTPRDKQSSAHSLPHTSFRALAPAVLAQALQRFNTMVTEETERLRTVGAARTIGSKNGFPCRSPFPKVSNQNAELHEVVILGWLMKIAVRTQRLHFFAILRRTRA